MQHNESRNDATLVIGAGELGIAMLHALVDRRTTTSGKIDVLLRPLDTQAPDPRPGVFQPMGVGVVRADLAHHSVADLARLFSGYATVICCTGFVGGPGTQRRITAAVLEAGVDRYVPWQFGVDYDVIGRGSDQGIFDEQIDVREMLRAQSRTHWVIVSTGMFTSFLFEPAFGVVDLEHARVHALGDWGHRLTVTTPEDIGRLTAVILAHVPRIDDQVVFVAGDTFSYARLADYVEARLDRKVERVLWPIDELRKAVTTHPEDKMRRYHLAFARDTGVAWDKEATFNARQGIPVKDLAGWLS
ncbi:MAG: hypothetical protein GAK28_01916 [Luteibacter sp.]|uniref:aromatic alcohol reductase n=1 Tax=Luteibacter sp. TaxID=1886636 RepID=UPI001384E746|nr:aromatic alcohol reductase [Luteibacter sp.]KAF1007277.1 MAG: hypothetical protein GAK28_01916 [Luteibacter sp.]